MYKRQGQKTKGIVFGSAFLGSLFATGYSWIKESQTREDYLAATLPDDISDGYATYNKWYQTRRTMMIVTTAVWAIAVGDAFLTPYARPTVNVGADGGMSLGININF